MDNGDAAQVTQAGHASSSSVAPAYNTSGHLYVPWGLTHCQSPNPARGFLVDFACLNTWQVFKGKLSKLQV